MLLTTSQSDGGIEMSSHEYRCLLRPGKMTGAFYYCVKNVVLRSLLDRWLDVQAEGLGNIPAGPCIIVTHHCLFFDGCVMAVMLERNIHGWIDEDVFSNPALGLVCRLLEQVPVATGSKASRDTLKRTMDTSVFWLKNTNDHIVLTNDGPSKNILDENGSIRCLSDRTNYSGAASLSIKTGVPVIPTAAWVSKEHQQELFVARGLKSARYLESNRKIPYLIRFSAPLYPSHYPSKHQLKDDIRRAQLETHQKYFT